MADRVTIIRKRYLARMTAGEVILCALCGEPVPKKATGLNKVVNGGKGGLSIDHIIEKSKGGTDRISNLQPTHILCNFLKSHPREINPKVKKLLVDTENMHDKSVD